jgi:pimeloyl-ACP methyl ester carboxylesterase
VSAVDALPQLVDMLGPTVKSTFDVVAFDPPGVGHSTPITCLDNTALGQYLHTDPAPPGPAAISEVVGPDQQLAAACKAHSSALLGHVSTADAARDMDLVRRSLGEPKVNYLGFSYGTSLGAAYAELFGSRIRAMVLDGAIDPSQAALPFLGAQAAALDAQFRRFAAACQASAACPWQTGAGQGGDLVAAFQALLARVRQNPIPVGDRTVGPSELLYGTIAGLYSTQSWPVIEEALADAEQGSGTLILAAFDQYVERSPDGTYNNTFEAESAVNCLDGPAPSVPAIGAAEPGFARADPVFGTLVLYGELACSVWPVPPTSAPHRIAAPAAPPIVVIGSTGDPVTPYADAQSLASQLAHGVLLTRVGDGHTGYGASSCVRAAADAYLINLTVPPAGTSCPSD